MARTSKSLPKQFPVGSKYVVESCGPVVRRYVEFPDGHKVTLPERRAMSCNKVGARLSAAAKEHTDTAHKHDEALIPTRTEAQHLRKHSSQELRVAWNYQLERNRVLLN